MKKEQFEAAVKLLTEYERLVIENLAMRALLNIAERRGYFEHSTLQEELDFLQKSQAADVIHAAAAPILQQIERAFGDAEFSRWLAENPQQGKPN